MKQLLETTVFLAIYMFVVVVLRLLHSFLYHKLDWNIEDPEEGGSSLVAIVWPVSLPIIILSCVLYCVLFYAAIIPGTFFKEEE